MFQDIAQQFLGGQAESMAGPELHGNVHQMAQNAPDSAVMDAVSGALGSLGSQGFGQSVQQAAQHATPEQRSSLMGTLLSAVEQGGGSSNNVLSQFGGGGGGGLGAAELGQLAAHVAENHPGVLTQLIGNELNSGGGTTTGGGGGMMQLLGNPMVRQIGMQLAQKAL
jgi:hypothetical protein